MFTAKDLLSMTDYFFILSTDETSCFELMSKNTNHCWKVNKGKGRYILYHSHNKLNGYHHHGEFDDLLNCILEIINHDEWKLNIWRYKNKGRRKQPYSYFDMLVENYAE